MSGLCCGSICRGSCRRSRARAGGPGCAGGHGCSVCAGVSGGGVGFSRVGPQDACLMVLQRRCLCSAGVGASVLGLMQRCFPVESLVEEDLCRGRSSVAREPAVLGRREQGAGQRRVRFRCAGGGPHRDGAGRGRGDQAATRGRGGGPHHQLTRWLLRGEELHSLGMLEAVDEVVRRFTSVLTLAGYRR